MRIGILGGTFNPIHNGHLFIAEETRVTFQLSRVIFVVNKIPPHRNDTALLDTEHRWNMINLAISTNPFFASSRVELDRPGLSYTIDTIRYFYNFYPQDSLFFITGLDSLLNYSWHEFEKLIDMLENFIIIVRPGYSRELLQDKIRTSYPYCSHKIIIFDSISLEISSTDIRKRLIEGKNIKYLLPDSVEKYIFDKGIYRNLL
jgi:nicotinate-nucleotide adenylyltransferase